TKDMRSKWRMGYFGNGIVESSKNWRDHVILLYRLIERLMVSEVKLEGMKKIRTTDDKIRDALKLHPRSIFDPQLAAETQRGIKKVYEDKGYLDTSVSYSSIPQADNQAIVVFTVNEAPSVAIASITFAGN